MESEAPHDKIARLLRQADDLLYRADRDPHQAGNGALIGAIANLLEVLRVMQQPADTEAREPGQGGGR